MVIFVWLSWVIVFFLILLFPLVFGEVMIVGRAKLHLDPGTATSIIVAVLLGGLVNIPVARIPSDEEILVHPLAAFGLFELWPEIRRIRRETVVAVNADCEA
jgi:uncharacterized membrane protein